MIEIPEAQTLAGQINSTLTGKTIATAEAGHAPHGFAFYHEDPALAPFLLEGRKIQQADALAGYVRIDAQESQMLFHDGVNMRYLGAEVKPPAKHQFLLVFQGADKMVCTVQMYGALMAFPKGEFDNAYYQVAREKPSPLSDAFDEGYFQDLLRSVPVKLSVKAFLATEQRIPGLGNGCLQDILFAAGVHPQSKLSALSDNDVQQMYASVVGVLKDMTAKGGRSTEKDLYGNPGGYQTILSSRTKDKPCPVCGTSISKKAYMGGNVYFCSNCQPLKV